MKRIALLATITALASAGLVGTAVAAPPPVDVWPDAGEAGTTVEVQVWGMTADSEFEVHGEALDGPLLGSGRTDSDGYGSVMAVIPSSAAEGGYDIEICEVSYVACTDTWSDFWVGRSAVFTVEPPAPTTTGIPEVRLHPATGQAGSVTRVFVSGFTPDAEFEVHGGDHGSGRIADGVPGLSETGEAELDLTIPADAAPGPFTVAVCEVTYVDCAETGNDFWVGASAGFTVEEPASPPTTEVEPEEPVAETEPAPTTTSAPTAPTVAPEITTTTVAAVGATEPVAFPAFQQETETSGSGPWWFLVLAAALGAGVLGLLVGRRLDERE